MNQSYLDQTYPEKRRILREYSTKNEISFYIDKMVDIINKKTENLHYNDNDLSEKTKNLIRSQISGNLVKDILIDGLVYLEIIRDEKNETTIGFSKLQPEILIPAYQEGLGNCWIQNPENESSKRMILDNQIICIDYNRVSGNDKTSYVEGLIKPYELLTTIEETVVRQCVINASKTEVFTVPIRSLSKERAEEQIGKMIANYSETIEWDDSLGTLTINDSKHLPYNKQIWLPDGEFGKATQAIHHVNTPITDVSILNYFKNKLLEASRIEDDKFSFKIANNLKELFLKSMKLM
jgi:hypothetical protein